MDFFDLVKTNRSYRGYDGNFKMTIQQLEHLVECARFCPSTVNMQPLKYFLSCDGETNGIILGNVTFAGRLKDIMKLPHKGKEPAAYIVVCHDKGIAPDPAGYLKDVGIVSQTMLLAACAEGLGGCMLSSFDPQKLGNDLGLPESIQPMLVLALGKSDEEIVCVDCEKDGNIAYYRDENDVHYVPKRKLEDLIIK